MTEPCSHSHKMGDCSYCYPEHYHARPATTAVASLNEHETLTVEISDRFTDAVKADALYEFFAGLAAEFIQLRQLTAVSPSGWREFQQRLDALNESVKGLTTSHNGSS